MSHWGYNNVVIGRDDYDDERPIPGFHHPKIVIVRLHRAAGTPPSASIHLWGWGDHGDHCRQGRFHIQGGLLQRYWG